MYTTYILCSFSLLSLLFLTKSFTAVLRTPVIVLWLISSRHQLQKHSECHVRELHITRFHLFYVIEIYFNGYQYEMYVRKRWFDYDTWQRHTCDCMLGKCLFLKPSNLQGIFAWCSLLCCRKSVVHDHVPLKSDTSDSLFCYIKLHEALPSAPYTAYVLKWPLL